LITFSLDLFEIYTNGYTGSMRNFYDTSVTFDLVFISLGQFCGSHRKVNDTKVNKKLC